MQSISLEKDDVFSSFRYSWWHIYVLIVMLLSLLGKMIILFTGKRSEVSCFLVEFLLRWCPTSCEWLNACVALERTTAVKYFAKYSPVKSKLLSKWITPTVLIPIAGLCTPELIFRQIII